jgi:hypothetical protein
MAFIEDSFFLIVREWACRKPDGFENALNQLRGRPAATAGDAHLLQDEIRKSWDDIP